MHSLCKNENIPIRGKYSTHNERNVLFALPSLGPCSVVGGKRQKTGSNRKNIGKRSKASGDLGMGKGCPFLSMPIFFPFSPHCGAWSQANFNSR